MTEKGKTEGSDQKGSTKQTDQKVDLDEMKVAFSVVKVAFSVVKVAFLEVMVAFHEMKVDFPAMKEWEEEKVDLDVVVEVGDEGEEEVAVVVVDEVDLERGSSTDTVEVKGRKLRKIPTK